MPLKMNEILFKLLKTDVRDYGISIIRCVLAVVIFAHGAQKLFGIWGGHGPHWTEEAWTQWWGIPPVLTYLVILIESFGAIYLFLGALTRVWAFLIGIVIIVAVFLVHWRWGFFMNWYMQAQTGEGFEYHLLVMAMVAFLMVKGGGKYSIDALLYAKKMPIK